MYAYINVTLTAQADSTYCMEMDDTNELADQGDSVNYVLRMHPKSPLLMDWATHGSNSFLDARFYGIDYTPNQKVRMITAKPAGYWAAAAILRLLAILENHPSKLPAW